MKNLIIETFKDKMVLVTGHTGFKGSWLSIWLRELGANVIGYALDPYTERDNFVKCSMSDKVIDIRGDIRDYNRIEQVFTEYSPEFVFHLAAQSLVRESYRIPKETYDVNVGGTVNVLENCRLSKSVKVIINVTSDKCYENRELRMGYREDDRLGGYDPYSSSKGCSELVTSAYRRSFFSPENFAGHGKILSSVRAGNVIGGGDWRTDRIIPDCIRDLENGKEILIRNPDAVRPWQFVLEPLGGYLLLAAKMIENQKKYSGAWNFGPEKTSIIPVKKLVDLVIKYWGNGSWISTEDTTLMHETHILSLNIEKVKKEMGWFPLLSVDEVVRLTIQWYRFYKQHENMYDFCKTQITDYMNRMDRFYENN
jgi:CDP-glucose 4,6-dehydratase